VVGPGNERDDKAAEMVRYVRYEGHQDVRRRHAPGKQHEHQLNIAPTRLGHYCIDSEDSNGGF